MTAGAVIGARRFERAPLFAEPVFTAAGVVFALLIVPTVAAMLLDERTHLGENIWIKPLKFEVALAIFTLTMGIYARWLPEGTVSRTWHRVYVASAVAAMGLEMIWIAGAAALGTSSHFNPTPTGEAIYRVMGMLAVWFTASTAVYGILIARNRAPDLDPVLRTGLALGLVLTFVLTVALAGTMAQTGGHLVGQDSGSGVWGTGWSRRVGDLRVAHFFGTHAMHAIPLVGFLAGWALPRRPAVVVTWASAGLWAALCVAIFMQALGGSPFIAG